MSDEILRKVRRELHVVWGSLMRQREKAREQTGVLIQPSKEETLAYEAWEAVVKYMEFREEKEKNEKVDVVYCTSSALG